MRERAMPEHTSVTEARKTLKELGKMSGAAQALHRKDIVAAFDTYWHGNPSRADFADTMTGMVIFSELLYIMVKP